MHENLGSLWWWFPAMQSVHATPGDSAGRSSRFGGVRLRVLPFWPCKKKKFWVDADPQPPHFLLDPIMTFETKLTMALAGCSGSCSANRWHMFSVSLCDFLATNPKILEEEQKNTKSVYTVIERLWQQQCHNKSGHNFSCYCLMSWARILFWWQKYFKISESPTSLSLYHQPLRSRIFLLPFSLWRTGVFDFLQNHL